MISDVKKTTEQKMHKTLEALKHDLAKVRTGRAHTGLLDHITVDYYGTPMPIPQVAARLFTARAGHRALERGCRVRGDPREYR